MVEVMNDQHNLGETIEGFSGFVAKAIEEVWASTDASGYLQALVSQAKEMTDRAIQLGDVCHEVITPVPKERTPEILEHFIVNYKWADRFKSFLVLWRDMIFEQGKAQLLHFEGKIPEAALPRLKASSRHSAESALEGLSSYFEEEIRNTRISRYGREWRIARWALEDNPWPVYREQLITLRDQCHALREEFAELRSTAASFVKIRELVFDNLDRCRRDLQSIEHETTDITAYIDEALRGEEAPRPGKVVTRLESLEEEDEAIEYADEFNTRLENQLNLLSEKQRVPVEPSLGLIQLKEINFQKSAARWLESEALPPLLELWSAVNASRVDYSTSLVNIRNRAVLLDNEIKEGKQPNFDTVNLPQPLIAFSAKLRKEEEHIQKVNQLLEERFSREFCITNLFYPERVFLPVPIQASFNQFMIDSDQLLGKTQSWFSRQRERVLQIKRSVEQEDSLSISEKTVRFLQSRLVEPSNSNYTSIFLTRGHIGESFWVGRDKELDHLQNLVANWQQGFRGSVLLSGRRLCGKSFFGDLAAHRFFPKTTIRVRPNSELVLPGRKITTGYNLDQALQAIKKYTLNLRPLIWIDDLELWAAPDIPLHRNVGALLKFIDSQATRMFFLVATTPWTKAQIERFHESQRVFQAEINLDRMTPAEVGQALIIRHGATHKNLVNDKGEEMNPQQFRKLVKKVYQSADGNIGDALHRWAASTETVDEESMRFHFRSAFPLPEIDGADALLLLYSVLMERQTSEYRLRKLLGPAFNGNYRHILQRLLNIGLLQRLAGGWLEVNELAVNDVAKLLQRKKYLQF